ncbi:MAG: hypothetical protein KKB31_03370 [Nanoarchaeota archaeon]|nr:hypothetical protein [Nanoarchaeota archaeon]
MNKKGQFYMLAAIVIISLFLGFIAIQNYSKTTKSTRVYDLKKELEIESGKFLDDGAKYGVYDWQSFTGNFSKHAGRDINIIYAVGIMGSLDVFRYDEDGVKIKDLIYSDNVGEVIITWEDVNYAFKTAEGQNFYFIIAQYINEERYIATNQ